ncbi:putative bifunctional diguanylate cyclase/phosphodiesterase [Dokdonella sp.]|uniref:putative bifunctional diguanylate cyclase/phosphodiesterase n=1 Tax=Dokdonella sp. TaxID=2291710 RepID=UPI003C34C3EF
MPFSNTLKYVSIQHELGMAIGMALRLRPMLLVFSRVCLRRLGLAAVHFHFQQRADGSVQLSADAETNGVALSHYFSLPLNSPAPMPSAFGPGADKAVVCVHQQQEGSENHTYAFNLGNFGVVTLQRIKGPLEQSIIELLKPLIERLGLSCQASIEHEGLLLAVAARKKAEETILHQLLHDDLTQLPNRRYLMQLLEAELVTADRNGTLGALLFLDLDRFKVVNDTLGHAIGDQLLIAVATKLQGLLGDTGIVSRLSGDEFVILLRGIASSQSEAVSHVDALLECIRNEFSGTILAGDHLLYVTPSTGIEIFPDGDCSAYQILRRADTAMYQAKLSGLNSSVYYDRQLSSELERRREIEKELQYALKDLGQFALHYQTQHDIAGRCIGAEALIRWNSPYRTDVVPNQFIPIAEETGLMLDLGRWVLEKSCADIRRFQDSNLPSTFRKVSVNVSPVQFNQDNLVDVLFGIIEESGANPELLAIELTETTLIHNKKAASAKMTALRSRGIEVIIDDFGTGFSSLSYLSRLPVGVLKIDQTFVRNIDSDPGNQAIVETIVALGRALDIQLIAEGVETQAEQACLTVIGCSQYQGFLYSKPAPLDDVLQTLAIAARERG